MPLLQARVAGMASPLCKQGENKSADIAFWIARGYPDLLTGLRLGDHMTVRLALE